MATLDLQSKNPFKVKLVEQGAATRTVVFDVSPDLVENQTVTYKNYDPVHMPGTIYVFGSSGSRTFSLSNIRLVCRSAEDATRNLYIINTLRGWTKPRFGSRSSTLSGTSEAAFGGTSQRERRNIINAAGNEAARQAQVDEFRQLAEQGRVSEGRIFGVELLGAPPAVLKLSAYADPELGTSRTLKGLIDRVPVVITQLSLPFTSESDYILTAEGTGVCSFIPEGVPVPAVMTVDLSLTETHSPREFSRFSLGHYRQGRLTGF